mmetsp:Transcript_7596/g.13711  ORF Transcript_7596/g.13711 Transcript_7596/m.13711 type:complete len:292 (-) Transcript_7596:104-979(-)
MPEAGELREGDWQCPNPACVNHTDFPQHFVYGAKVNCPKCGTGKFAQRAGDWCCPNAACLNHRNTVYGSKNQCSKCGTAKPLTPGQPLMAAVGVPQQQYQQQQYQHQPLQPNQPPPPSTPYPYGCGMQGQAAARAATPVPGNPRPGDWNCPNPACKNHTANLVYGTKSQCPLCGTPKPAAPTMMPPQAQMQQPTPTPVPVVMAPPMASQQPRTSGSWPGDWHCPNQACKNHAENVVYASKTVCPLCNTPKPLMVPAGAAAARPGDWQCPNPACKNHVNLVSRSPMGAGFGH